MYAKTNQDTVSKLYTMTREVNICQMNFTNSWQPAESHASTLPKTCHNRMGLQNGMNRSLNEKLQPSKQVRHAQPFWGKMPCCFSVHTWNRCPSKTMADQSPYKYAQKGSRCISSLNLGVYSLHTHRERESDLTWAHTWKNASLLDILRHQGMEFIIPKPTPNNIWKCWLWQKYFMYKISSRPNAPTRIRQLPEDEEDKINNKQLENSPHQNTGSPGFSQIEELNNRTDSPNGQEPVGNQQE